VARLTEETYCLLSLSRKDERFKCSSLADVTNNWLLKEKKAEVPYLFAEKSPRRLEAGSKLLFSFEAQIFGKATTKTGVENVSLEQQENWRKKGIHVYKHSITLRGTSVKQLTKTVSKKQITEKLGIKFGQVFRYLTKDEYNAILQMAK
jgi:hypothetical protein